MEVSLGEDQGKILPPHLVTFHQSPGSTQMVYNGMDTGCLSLHLMDLSVLPPTTLPMISPRTRCCGSPLAESSVLAKSKLLNILVIEPFIISLLPT